MKVLYIAKHEQSVSNDDEGAIADALTKLGCEVTCVRETGNKELGVGFDFALFHHPQNLRRVQAVKCPKAFWCFDLVDYPDSTLADRCEKRQRWASRMTELCEFGFFTDGDHVARVNDPKVRWLPQGADQRRLGRRRNESKAVSSAVASGCDLLFTGISRGGAGRQSWVDEMQRVYGPKFNHYFSGKHGRVLSELVAGARIVLAPDSPVTNRYWSNRVYLTLGCGGFLLHPYCAGLYAHYDDKVHLVYYRSRAELHDLIRFYLDRQDLAMSIAQAGLARTTMHHTYVNRCQELLRIVKERLK